jgi:hypothetical protein
MIKILNGHTKVATFNESALLNGNAFLWTTSSMSLTGSVPKVYRFTVPSNSTTKVYLSDLAIVSSDAEARITLTEAQVSSSVTNAGPPVTRSYNNGTTLSAVYNTDQNISKTPGSVLAENATFMVAGLKLNDLALTSSYTTIWQGRTKSGSYVLGQPLLALKSGSAYEVKVTNLNSSANNFDARICFIENQQ